MTDSASRPTPPHGSASRTLEDRLVELVLYARTGHQITVTPMSARTVAVERTTELEGESVARNDSRLV